MVNPDKGSDVTNPTRPSDAGGVGEVEALCAELVAELREMRDTVSLYQTTIADAARYIARGLADRLILPVSDPHGHELAAALARMGEVSVEVEELLSVPIAALRAAVNR
jgi:hypothetical protein